MVESWLEEAETEAARVREQARLDAQRLVADATEVGAQLLRSAEAEAAAQRDEAVRTLAGELEAARRRTSAVTAEAIEIAHREADSLREAAEGEAEAEKLEAAADARAAELVARAMADANQLRGQAETEAARILANAEEEARARREAAEHDAVATRARVSSEMESAEEQLAPAEIAPAEIAPAEIAPAEFGPAVGLAALLASDGNPDEWMVIGREPIAAPEEHRRGFFSRLFHRRRHSDAA